MKNNNLFPDIEAFSLFGEPLFQIPLLPEIHKKQIKLFNEALKKYKNEPNNADNIIWLGRRVAYLGRFRDAITIFTRGIKKFPNDARMYRHRGHRFITLRLFKLAIEDFSKAASLIKNKQDEIEPDGMPNTHGIPVSSLHTNIWYHLGLANYLERKYKFALNAYEKCMNVSKLADNYVSTGHWMYMTYRLLDKKKDANNLLKNISDKMDVIENHHYHECMMMYKGEIKTENLLSKAKQQGGIGFSTIGYGIANWFYYNNQEEKAKSILKEILSLENWASFGYIAAESDLFRLKQNRTFVG